eukprot:767836-Hanusia_phi.AAC.2
MGSSCSWPQPDKLTDPLQPSWARRGELEGHVCRARRVKGCHPLQSRKHQRHLPLHVLLSLRRGPRAGKQEGAALISCDGLDLQAVAVEISDSCDQCKLDVKALVNQSEQAGARTRIVTSLCLQLSARLCRTTPQDVGPSSLHRVSESSSDTSIQ